MSVGESRCEVVRGAVDTTDEVGIDHAVVADNHAVVGRILAGATLVHTAAGATWDALEFLRRGAEMWNKEAQGGGERIPIDVKKRPTPDPPELVELDLDDDEWVLVHILGQIQRKKRKHDTLQGLQEEATSGPTHSADPLQPQRESHAQKSAVDIGGSKTPEYIENVVNGAIRIIPGFRPVTSPTASSVSSPPASSKPDTGGAIQSVQTMTPSCTSHGGSSIEKGKKPCSVCSEEDVQGPGVCCPNHHWTCLTCFQLFLLVPKVCPLCRAPYKRQDAMPPSQAPQASTLAQVNRQ